MYELADRPLSPVLSRSTRNHLFRYGFALALVSLALCLSLLLHPLLSDAFLVLFFAAVMASGWFGGTGPGLFAVFLSTISFSYCFVSPFYSWSVNRNEVPYVLSFLLSAIFASWLSAARKHAEDNQRAHLKELFEQGPEAILLLDPKGRVLQSNPEFSRMFGYLPEEMAGRQGVALIVPEDFQQQDRAVRERLERGEKISLETVRRRKNGSRLHVSELAVPIFVEGRRVADYMIFRDITESKTAAEALHAAKAELAHLSRLTTLGEMLASIAHEVNQPVGAIVMNSNAGSRWLAGSAPNLAEANQAFLRIERDATRITEIISHVRGLVKKGPTKRSRIDLNDLIASVLNLAENELQHRTVSVRTELADGLPGIIGDRVQFQQVLLNLIMNSLDAMDDASSKSRALRIGSRREGSHVLVYVEDTGPGLDLEQLDSLFHPFFTTKPTGLGMGLSISRSIIEAHDGRLWAEPAAGGGALFQFTLPIAKGHHG